MEINVIIEGDFEGCPGEEWFLALTGAVLEALGTADGVEIGLVITGQERITALNREYRGRDEPTDVLSFFMSAENAAEPEFVNAPDGIRHLGEVIISFPQAALQAEEEGHPVREELKVLIIHGVLHLLGYDHEKPDEQQVMQEREREIKLSLEAKEDFS